MAFNPDMSKRWGMNDPETKLVSKEDVAAAAALNGIKFNFARAIGPALAGGGTSAAGRALDSRGSHSDRAGTEVYPWRADCAPSHVCQGQHLSAGDALESPTWPAVLPEQETTKSRRAKRSPETRCLRSRKASDFGWSSRSPLALPAFSCACPVLLCPDCKQAEPKGRAWRCPDPEKALRYCASSPSGLRRKTAGRGSDQL